MVFLASTVMSLGQTMTCGDLRGIYQANACCAATSDQSVSGLPGSPNEPQVPGIKQGTISLALDVDYPPYAYMAVPPEGDYELAGFGVDVAHGLKSVCPNLEFSTRQTTWSECWDGTTGLNTYGQGPKAGKGIEQGYYHGCMTYTHTTGVRNRYLEFSNSILQANKPSGLLTRLENGVPHVHPNSSLAGLTIVDVAGWAPTADGLALVTNWCTGSRYSGYTIVVPPVEGNDAAMEMLMSGQADAMWVYADQAYNFQPSAGVVPSWNVSLWEGFGTKYAYIVTGQFGHAYNGTTLAVSKKGSGLASVLNPCIDAFLQTRAYYDACLKHAQEGSCYPNAYWNGTVSSGAKPWMLQTTEQAAGCADGYCSCDV